HELLRRDLEINRKRHKRSQLPEMKSAVDVDDFASTERKSILSDRGNRFCDVIRRSPSSNGGKALGDEFVVLFFDWLCHVRCDDTRSHFVNVDAMLCKARCKKSREHGQAGLGDTIFAAICGCCVSADGADGNYLRPAVSRFRRRLL